MKRTEYNHNNLEGMDADIETSLKEYGFAWIETEKDYLFYYGTNMDKIECIKYSFCSLEKDFNIKEEHTWVNWGDINSYLGRDIMDGTLPQQIDDLIGYYGCANVFGSSYWEGLSYEDIVKEER